MVANPVLEWHDLVNLSPKTNIALSPDAKIVITGASVRKNHGQGVLHGFCTKSGERVIELPMGTSSVITSFWHESTNQIFVGMGDGKIEVLYSPQLSKGGVMKCVNKQEKRRMAEQNSVLNNSAFQQPVFTETFSRIYGKSKFVDQETNFEPVPILKAEIFEPVKKRDKKIEVKKQAKPEMPLQGPAKGGRTP